MDKRFLLAVLLPTVSFGEMTRVFVGTGNAGIYTMELNEKNGALQGLTQAYKASGTGFLAMKPGGEYLYATVKEEKQGTVVSLKVEGAQLQETSQQSYPGGGLCHISLDATNGVLFGADYGGGSVVSFPLVEDSTVGAYASFVKHQGSSIHPKRQKKPYAHSFYAGPQNRYAYAVDLGTDKVEIYRFDSKTATILPVGAAKVPPGSGARHMKFSRDGMYAYVLNELSLTITVFKRDSQTGLLTELETVSVLPKGGDKEKMSCSEILVSNGGKFVYCANRDVGGKKRDSLSAFQVGEDGRLTLLQTVPAEVSIPRNINLTPSGNCLLVAGQRSNEVEVFLVDQQTGLLKAAQQRVEVPRPMCIVFP